LNFIFGTSWQCTYKEGRKNKNRKMCRKENFIILIKLKTAVNGEERETAWK